MSQLVYPNPIVPGAPEDVAQVNSSFAAAAGTVNGQLGGVNLAAGAIGDSLQRSPSMLVWRRVFDTFGLVTNNVGLGLTFVLREGGYAATFPDNSGAITRINFFVPDIADLARPGRRTMLRMGGTWIVNGAAVLGSFDVCPYRIDGGSASGYVKYAATRLAGPVLPMPEIGPGGLWAAWSPEIEFSAATFPDPGQAWAMVVRRLSGATAPTIAALRVWLDVRWVPA